MFGFRRAEPDPGGSYTENQVQTFADGDTCKEAVNVVRILSGGGNAPDQVALRKVVNGRNAEYLYSRFATQFGWTKPADAQAFYNANKRGWFR